jgi:hypothetical protein
MTLLIRAARNDHSMIEKLCAPATAGLWSTRRLPLTGVVADASVAAQRPLLGKTAAAAGIPYIIDPVTPLLQDEQAPDHAWARLPFAAADQQTPAGLSHPALQDELLERTFDFQREQGATLLVPPYLYSARRDDGWFDVNLQLLRRAARYLEQQGIDLPVVPVFAASLLEFGPRATWQTGLDRFLDVAADMNLRFVALSWSASQPGKEGYTKLAHLFTATRHAAGRVPVIGWRQGLYGLALTACGAAGYETGAGQSERCHYPEFWARRRPQDDDAESSAHGSAYVYFSTFGRSLPRNAGRALLDNASVRGSLVCVDDAGCCPDGAKSMIGEWREHAIRSRARELQEMQRMPASIAWRLNRIARGADRSLADARLANAVLAEVGLRQRLPEATFRDLSRVADEVRTRAAEDVA